MTTRKRFVKYSGVRAQETASFWREIVIAIVILLRALADCGSGGSNLWTVRRFLSFCDQERASPPSIQITVLTFIGKKKLHNEAFRDVHFFLEYEYS